MTPAQQTLATVSAEYDKARGAKDWDRLPELLFAVWDARDAVEAEMKLASTSLENWVEARGRGMVLIATPVELPAEDGRDEP
jgi:hypothetical protein